MRTDRPLTRPWRAAACALGLTMGFSFLVHASTRQDQTPELQARVPTTHANVHEAPGSGSALLVMVPRDTVLPVIGRQGEWVQVELSPELRKTGIVVRWYEGTHEIVRRGRQITIGDEESGWMHDSTVEITEVASSEEP